MARAAATGTEQVPAVINVQGLMKHYADYTAVAGIDLEVPAGEIFALLGPNGAGKTTTLKFWRATGGGTGGPCRCWVSIRRGRRWPGGPGSAWWSSRRRCRRS